MSSFPLHRLFGMVCKYWRAKDGNALPYARRSTLTLRAGAVNVIEVTCCSFVRRICCCFMYGADPYSFRAITVPANENSVETGGAAVGAVLLQSLSGALSPWAVEWIPGLFASFFAAFGQNKRTLCRVVILAVDV